MNWSLMIDVEARENAEDSIGMLGQCGADSGSVEVPTSTLNQMGMLACQTALDNSKATVIFGLLVQ